LTTALAGLVNLDGSSSRPRGSLSGICEDGRHIGIISSGCAEDAIIAEGLEVLQSGDNHVTRYGKDSPYLDVVLPCGSGLDILFISQGLEALTAQVTGLHDARRPAFLSPQDNSTLRLVEAAASSSAASPVNEAPIEYEPDYYLHIFGAGPQLTYFAGLAQTMGYQIFTHSTDAQAIEELRNAGIDAQAMTHQTRFDPHSFDRYSAVVTLFHEHDLEIPILQAALDSNAHFIGAMGSRKTHATRQLALQDIETKRPFNHIIGPVGLDIGATDPSEIALSILAQIVEKRRRS